MVKWTKEQQQAIEARGTDTLVAAAAGSGKTAVLVERLIRRITDPKDPLDVDNLLVVTFTDAAAAEMRKRIGEALEQELANRPGDESLKRQLALINKAHISTFHSFCLSVLRRYYYLTDLDPGFRVGDTAEIELIKEEVLEELLEEEYGQEDEEFYRLVDCYTADRNDAKLQQLVLDMYHFSRSNPWPGEWLQEISRSYKVDPESSMDQLLWTQQLLESVKTKLTGAKEKLIRGIELCEKPGGPNYKTTLQQELIQVEELIVATASFEALHKKYKGLHFERLKPCKGDEYDDILKEAVKELRDEAKGQVRKIKDEYFDRSPAQYLADLQKMAPVVGKLTQLVEAFATRFQEAKQERSLVDYSDLEHYCLQIMSEASNDYSKKFSEILVDEYQDTNMVQETILQLVAGGEASGKLFMVGDVKQSIYRFRLAEPQLFLNKYLDYGNQGQDSKGLLIDLAKNFRSRTEVLAGTNFLFKQLMSQRVGEIAYDVKAQLIYGANYPQKEENPIELMVVDKSDLQESEAGEEQVSKMELETAQLEARLMAEKVKELIGKKDSTPFQVYDKKAQVERNIKYRDIVILLRASKNWAPTILEEFKRQGIPAYADLTTGYFEATEVNVLMSLLKVIDNPRQDIPLAAVLRSPLVGLTGEELAQIRVCSNADFYSSCIAFLEREQQENGLEIYSRLDRFLGQLGQWREEARRGSLADLIWKIYTETGYYDLVGGMPGGNQRQANLRALYDRARQYEATSFRGLFRFLRFVERLRDRGGDFGAARALGEQEDVVRVMTIHKSKGLEFPVVFVAGMNKQFNMQDLRKPFMFHKQLGFGTRIIDPIARLSTPSLSQMAIKEKMHLELLAEEMRLLYVAMTRAEEKLFMVGTVKDFEKQCKKWRKHMACQEWLLPDYERANCNTYLDWVGMSLIRHSHAQKLWRPDDEKPNVKEVCEDPSQWHIEHVSSDELAMVEEDQKKTVGEITEKIMAYSPIDVKTRLSEQIDSRLTWNYLHMESTTYMSKQTVSDIKRAWESAAAEMESENSAEEESKIIYDRPGFLQQQKMNQAEVGVVTHKVMQHLDFSNIASEDAIRGQIEAMVTREQLTAEQAEAVEASSVVNFFQSSVGQRMLASSRIEREIPFSLALPSREIYRDWQGGEEHVLLQGVIDSLFFEDQGIVLIDYKTDRIKGKFSGGFAQAEPILRQRYQLQLQLYAKAVERIWHIPVKEKYLFFFDHGGHLLEV
ncbi:ATP-dependent helicase/nuclease subunit A [Desulfitispora alkaliphila]|uniref:helicase-exonuclease AddAB subunit AddA n=1 Tax=Desulfitispora alkaliphila TaxID=622674 RepID=UPI003D1D8B74